MPSPPAQTPAQLPSANCPPTSWLVFSNPGCLRKPREPTEGAGRPWTCGSSRRPIAPTRDLSHCQLQPWPVQGLQKPRLAQMRTKKQAPTSVCLCVICVCVCVFTPGCLYEHLSVCLCEPVCVHLCGTGLCSRGLSICVALSTLEACVVCVLLALLSAEAEVKVHQQPKAPALPPHSWARSKAPIRQGKPAQRTPW